MENGMWQLGLSTNAKRITEQTFAEYAENGVQNMEISSSQIEDITHHADFGAFRRYAAAYGVTVWSLHLPFAPFERMDISSLNAQLRKSSVEICKDVLRKAPELGARIAVIHPSAEPIRPEDRAARIEQSRTSLAELAEYAAPLGITVAVEDLPRTCLGNCSAEIRALIAADDRLRVCFDTNHLLTEKNVDFARALGDKIVTLHVSDYDFRDEKHWMPGEGKSDWRELVDVLHEVHYAGVFMYEVNRVSSPTIRRDREVSLADIAENYRLCMARQPLKPLGSVLVE
ncbi:MAG: sugar phosphate isomerase/epimerase family protein [Eubacteriales bacterium]